MLINVLLLPISTEKVISATGSFGAKVWFSAGLVSNASISGSTSKTSSQASFKLAISPALTLFNMFLSMSENSLDLNFLFPIPPRRISITWKANCGFVSNNIDPLKGGILNTVKTVGLGIEWINSS